MDTPATYTPSLSSPSSPSLSSPTHQLPSDGMRGVLPSSPGPVPASSSVPLKPLDHSSWIGEVLYLACRDGKSYMAIFKSTPGEIPEAMLYGPNIPSWLPGLLQAGVKDAQGKLSVGRAYNKHVKGKYVYTSVKGRKEVGELRRLFVLYKDGFDACVWLDTLAT